MVRICPPNAGDMGSNLWSGKIPHAERQLIHWATTTELTHSRACAPMKAREATATRVCSLQLEKAHATTKTSAPKNK